MFRLKQAAHIGKNLSLREKILSVNECPQFQRATSSAEAKRQDVTKPFLFVNGRTLKDADTLSIICFHFLT